MVPQEKGLATAKPPLAHCASSGWTSGFYFFALIFAFASVPLAISNVIAWVPDSQDHKFTNAISLIGTVIAAVGTGVAIYSFARNAVSTRAQIAEQNALARAQHKKQHTITILFESRMSPELRDANMIRKRHFPPGQPIDYADWNKAYHRCALRPSMTKKQVEERYKAAEALLTLLNYHEFLALGIALDDLDPDLLKGSLRGIMCSLVDDAHFVISELRTLNPKTYEHLVALYSDWSDKSPKFKTGALKETPLPD